MPCETEGSGQRAAASLVELERARLQVAAQAERCQEQVKLIAQMQAAEESTAETAADLRRMQADLAVLRDHLLYVQARFEHGLRGAGGAPPTKGQVGRRGLTYRVIGGPGIGTGAA